MKEKVKLYSCTVKRETSTGIPEPSDIITFEYEIDIETIYYQLLEEHGFFVCQILDKIYIFGLTKMIVNSWVTGFVGAHSLSVLSPLRTLNLHTLN